MRHSAASVIGVNHFQLFGRMELLIHLDENELPLELPHVETYKPGPEGEGPLANIPEWRKLDGGTLETNTMPGYAGSSGIFFVIWIRIMIKNFATEKHLITGARLIFISAEQNMQLVIYCTAACGRKFLYDLGLIGHDEPYKRLVNQGMIQGSSRFVYRLNYNWHSNNQFCFIWILKMRQQYSNTDEIHECTRK